MTDSFSELHPVCVSISGESQEELPVMTAVCQVIDLAGNEITVCPWHAEQTSRSSPVSIDEKNGGSKSIARPIYIDNEFDKPLQPNRLLRSDPEIRDFDSPSRQL